MSVLEKKVLLIAADRSGSNLIKSILNQHPCVYFLPSLPLFEQLYYILDDYGDLTRADRWNLMVADIVDLVDANHHPLPCSLSVEQMQHKLRDAPRTLGAAVQAAFELQLEHEAKPVGGVKFGVQLEKLRDFFAQTSFSHILFQYRDPRDVVLSHLAAGVNPAPPQEIAAYWLDWHRAIRKHAASFSIPTIESNYEDLLSNTEETLSRIWSFLEVPPCDDALDFYRDARQVETAKISHMWRNLTKPLMRNNFNKFYREWNLAAVTELEEVLGRGLAEFGYEPCDPARFESDVREPQRRVVTDSDREFHKPQEDLMNRIRARAKQAT